MDLNLFHEMVLDGHERIEPSHRVLEDQGNLFAANPPIHLTVQLSQVSAMKQDLPFHARIWRKNSENRLPQCRLPTTGLANYSKGLSLEDD